MDLTLSVCSIPVDGIVSGAYLQFWFGISISNFIFTFPLPLFEIWLIWGLKIFFVCLLQVFYSVKWMTWFPEHNNAVVRYQLITYIYWPTQILISDEGVLKDHWWSQTILCYIGPHYSDSTVGPYYHDYGMETSQEFVMAWVYCLWLYQAMPFPMWIITLYFNIIFILLNAFRAWHNWSTITCYNMLLHTIL